MNNKKTEKMMEEYLNLLQNPLKKQDNRYKEYFNKKVCLESELRDIVLTGEEFIKMSFVRKISDFSRLYHLQKEKDHTQCKNKLEASKKGLVKIARRYAQWEDETLEKHEGELKEVCNECWTLKRIEEIISGKQGAIIDEIKEALYD